MTSRVLCKFGNFEFKLYPVTQDSRCHQSITATVTNVAGVVQTNVPVTFTVAGANPQVLTATTNAAGQAIVSYSGTNVGSDTVQATAQINNQQLISAQLVLQWTTP